MINNPKKWCYQTRPGPSLHGVASPSQKVGSGTDSVLDLFTDVMIWRKSSFNKLQCDWSDRTVTEVTRNFFLDVLQGLNLIGSQCTLWDRQIQYRVCTRPYFLRGAGYARLARTKGSTGYQRILYSPKTLYWVYENKRRPVRKKVKPIFNWAQGLQGSQTTFISSNGTDPL